MEITRINYDALKSELKNKYNTDEFNCDRIRIDIFNKTGVLKAPNTIVNWIKKEKQPLNPTDTASLWKELLDADSKDQFLVTKKIDLLNK